MPGKRSTRHRSQNGKSDSAVTSDSNGEALQHDLVDEATEQAVPREQVPIVARRHDKWHFLWIVLRVGAVIAYIPIILFLLYVYRATYEEDCEVLNLNATNSIKDAKTAFCKAELKKFACCLQNDLVYPKNIPNLCPTGEPTFEPEANTTELAENGTPRRVRILYLLMVYGRDSRQVRRLLQLVYRDEHYFIIHIDIRDNFLFDELLSLETVLPNLKLTRNRQLSIWGGTTFLTVVLDAIKTGLADWPDWDYFINLSETDLPIQSNDELVAYLSRNNGRNFVRKSDLMHPRMFIEMQGLNRSFFECEGRMWGMGKRTLPDKVTFNGASNWYALHRNFCQYLMDEEDSDLVFGVRRFHNHSVIPGESFFHTILYHSRFCNTVLNHDLRFNNWHRYRACICRKKSVIDWCGCSPSVFKMDDLETIREQMQSTNLSHPVYIARKFDPMVDLNVIESVLIDLYYREFSDSDNKTKPLPASGRHWLNLYRHGEPYPNKALRVLLESLTRLTGPAEECSDSAEECRIRGPDSGILINAHVTVDLSGVRTVLIEREGFDGSTTESLVEQVDHFQWYTAFDEETNPARRILHIEVSTDYDHKDRAFRNYAKAMGQLSDLALCCITTKGEEFVVIYVWIDPTGAVAGSFEHNLTADALISTVEPSFPKPLLPGVWTVQAVYKSELVATTKFLILPTELPSNKTADISNEDFAMRLNQNLSVPESKMGLDNQVQETKQNSNGTAIEDTAWIDGLVSVLYRVKDVCVTSKESEKTGYSGLALCIETVWSSFYPDDTLLF